MPNKGRVLSSLTRRKRFRMDISAAQRLTRIDTEKGVMNSIPTLLLALAALIVIGFYAVSFFRILSG